jgi:hypothetical protein
MDLEEWEEALPFLDDALIVLAESPGGDSPEMVCTNTRTSGLMIDAPFLYSFLC